MKKLSDLHRNWLRVFCLFFLSVGTSAFSATVYVDENSPEDGPGTSWYNAYHTIQDAIRWGAEDGDTVLVTNGYYSTGKTNTGTDAFPVWNRVVIKKPIVVRSVNGPSETWIAGELYSTKIRCAYISNGGSLVGFELSTGQSYNGGGVYMNGGSLSNCVVKDCLADNTGGGVYALGSPVISQCTFFDNGSWGSYSYSQVDGGRLYNCSILGNTSCGTAVNSIIWNTGRAPASEGFTNCCTDWATGVNCITNDPLFISTTYGSEDLRLQPGSPCIDAGLNQPWMAAATDLDGKPRILGTTVDIGAYEFGIAPAFVDITNASETVAGSTGTYTVGGNNNIWTVGSLWWENAANGAGGSLPVSGTAFQIAGIPLEFFDNIITVYGSNEVGSVVHDSVVITRDPQHAGPSPVHYASLTGGNSWPYTNWPTAANTIQDAVNAAAPGDLVQVANGTYEAGSTMGNRIYLNKAVFVESVGGPGACMVSGVDAQGSNAVRCAYIANGASLAGFTLANGQAGLGGGALLESGVVSNCVIQGNTAFQHGGGVLCDGGGSVIDCTIQDNSAINDGGGLELEYGGFAEGCIVAGNSAGRYGGGSDCWDGGELTDCTFSENTAYQGGGAYCYLGTIDGCTFGNNSADEGGGIYLKNNGWVGECTLTGNQATYSGGGAYTYMGGNLDRCTIIQNTAGDGGAGVMCNSGGTLDRCRISENESSTEGGGAYCMEGGVLDNCVIDANSATVGGGAYSPDRGRLNHCTISANGSEAAVVFAGVLNNCILQDNLALNWSGSDALWTNCCASPVAGANGTADDPGFVGGDDFHLTPGSPCIDAAFAVPGIVDDFDGTRRPLDGDGNGLALPDIGAYEFASEETDTDGDQVSDHAEFVADTDGTDSNDWFRIAILPEFKVGYASSAARQYTLVYATNLVEGAWHPVPGKTGIPGTGGYSLLDCPSNYPACFFQMEVEIP